MTPSGCTQKIQIKNSIGEIGLPALLFTNTALMRSYRENEHMDLFSEGNQEARDLSKHRTEKPSKR